MIRIYDVTGEDRVDIGIYADINADPSVEKTVDDILARVRQEGDTALLAYTEQFDKAKLSSLQVTEEEIEEAYHKTDSYFIETLEQAKANIERFHQRQVRSNYCITEDGVVMGQQVNPIAKVGIYVPGGTASYPSTVLMNAIPAKIAGVGEIVMVTPPDSRGNIAPAILAAAKVAGVDKIFKVGGAQAIAALSYGTDSVPKVDKIVGPGNIFVATAKRKVYGLVDIDMIAGPSEILVIADESADPRHVAADMLSQAEHDRLASAYMVTTSMKIAKEVQAEIEKQLAQLTREEIARDSIENNGQIFVMPSMESALELANSIAPEHLEVCTENPFAYLDSIKNAGSIFLGHHVPEALGDYFAGPNHTLPTSSTARFSSPLGVDDFVKKSSFIYYTKEALGKVKDRVADFAAREGLDGHARSVTIRFDGVPAEGEAPVSGIKDIQNAPGRGGENLKEEDTGNE